jgi:Tol biopolymer transport system component
VSRVWTHRRRESNRRDAERRVRPAKLRHKAAVGALLLVAVAVGDAFASGTSSAPGLAPIESIQHPAWSPTRREIAFKATLSDGSVEIDIAAPDGSALRPIEGSEPGNSGGAGPWWSPDGDYLAFAGFDGRASFVAAARRDGSSPPAKVVFGEAASWAPDSHRLALDAEDPTGSPTWLTVVDMQTGALERIGPEIDHDGHGPAWAPRRDVIAYSKRNVLYTVVLRGRVRRRIGLGEKAAWSADGRLLAFTAPGGIYVSAAGGRRRRLVLRATVAKQVAWSPRRRALAVLVGRGAFVIDVTRHHIRRILGPQAWSPSGLDGPSWSPDGRRLVFATGSRLYIVGADGNGGHFISPHQGDRREEERHDGARDGNT